MPMMKSKGNMYGFVTHTWNAISGACPFDCEYCYMKKWDLSSPPRLNARKLENDNLGSGNFIFVGSSIDMWGDFIPSADIARVLEKLRGYKNQYFFQSKNPARFGEFLDRIPNGSWLCTTVETNRNHGLSKAPPPADRVRDLEGVRMLQVARPDLDINLNYSITVEPILAFDREPFLDLLWNFCADQISVGAATGGHVLPEPSISDVRWLVDGLQRSGATIHIKPNLRRILQ